MKRIKIILGLVLLASVTTFAQSPRIKLNQITKDTVKGSVLISSPSDSGMVYSRDFYVAYGADTVLILYGDTLGGVGGGFASVLSDGVTIIGNGTIGSELTADTSVLATLRALSDSLVNYVSTTELSDSTSNIRTDIPLIISDSLLVYVSRTELSDSLALISSSVTADNVTITGDGTVGSPLEVDTLTYIATKQDLDSKQDQLNGTGFVKATGTTISYDNSTYLTSEVDGDASNELQTLSYNSSTNEITLSDGGGTEDLSNLDLVDSTRINATGDTAFYYQNGVEIGSQAIAGGGGTSYNNISEDGDTVLIDKFLNVDTSTLYVDATNNRVAIGQTQTLSGAALSIRGGMHIVDPDITNFADAIMYIYPKEQTTSGPNASEFAIYMAGPGSTNSIQGPNFILRGKDFTRFGNQRGAILFLAATSISSPTGDDGTITFFTDGGSLKVRYDGGLEVTNLGDTTGVSANMYYNTTTKELMYITSSQRYKTNIRDYDRGINDLMKLRPVYYQPKNSTTNNNIYNTGFIAEEVESIGLTEYIDYDENGLANSIHYSLMTAILTKATQEQQAIIETQEQKITDLETTIQSLITRIENLENK